ncbi:hypothetical protein COLO4_31658 [Corchorus olitorius]|uniref:S-locus receptor kinase C-terminal domain-containing protein n=1 Tax=Corchorus olitorius TaxID=93759 RepID=A0A1R3H3Q7_9ROSI|nr:hypothetical protein COLO4_31658 [Corchorus olitorius]
MALICWFLTWKKKIIRANQPEIQATITKVESQEDFELPLFEFSTIQAATNNFSATNKIGEGGFGPVYKGELLSGQEVAVKRLAENSGQGLHEFKNEQKPEDRPAMQTVLLMLDSESMSLPQPGRPGFYAERCLSETDSSSLGKLISNEITVTLIEGR